MSYEPCPKFNSEQETFTEFVERFKVQCSDLLVKAGDDQKKKAAVLIKALPVSIITDLQRRIKPTLLSDATYDLLFGKLSDQFTIKKSIVGASVKFLNRQQASDESIENYALVINNLAASCKYKACCMDRLIRDVFIAGLRSTDIMSGLLTDCEADPDKTFNDCVAKAKLLEQIHLDANDIRPENKSAIYKLSNDEGASSNKVGAERNSHGANIHGVGKKAIGMTTN